MKKVYFLKTCDTCKRIMSNLDLADFELHEIKSNPLQEADVELLYSFTKNYEALFNKRAILYKSMQLSAKNLSENEYKNLLLQEYTFLKRPVFIVDNQIFIGNSKSVINELTTHLNP